MAQRQDQVERQGADVVGQSVGQPPRLDEVEGGLCRFLLPGAGQDVAAVIILARIAEGVPVRHLQLRAALVEIVVGRIPERTIMLVARGLEVDRALLIAGRRLVAAEDRKSTSQKSSHKRAYRTQSY